MWFERQFWGFACPETFIEKIADFFVYR